MDGVRTDLRRGTASWSQTIDERRKLHLVTKNPVLGATGDESRLGVPYLSDTQLVGFRDLWLGNICQGTLEPYSIKRYLKRCVQYRSHQLHVAGNHLTHGHWAGFCRKREIENVT